jgi:amino acid adenylation domain-containing protein
LIDLGIERGDRVAIMVGNRPQAVIAMYGVMKAGAVFVMVSDQLKGQKLAYILDNCQAQVLISHASRAQVVKEAMWLVNSRPQIIWVEAEGGQNPLKKGHRFEELVRESSIHQATDWPRVIDVDLACLIYTSGSTGQPKGIMSTHHNMVSAARSIIQYIGNEPDDVVLDVLPLSFDYGLYQVIMTFMFGGTVVLERSFVYLHEVLSRIAQHRVTGWPVVPTIVAMLLRLQDLGRYDLGSLRYMTNTGAALPTEHIARLRKLLPHVRIYSMFGLIECKRVWYLDPGQLDSRPGSVGKVMPNCEVFIVDQDGRQLGPGQVGQLVVRGANVMQGYWADQALTDRTFRPGSYPEDRRLFTGDLFKMDEDGYLYFVGRQDDMIKCKGERVSPKEVEDTLLQMPGVSEVAVIGVPDDVLGQAIKAFVIPMPGRQILPQEVTRFAVDHLEPFMVPKHVEIVSDLPRTPNGKVDKRQLAIR